MDDLFEQLSRPNAYSDRPEKVDRRETHISSLFFTEDRVYKVKKPVKLPFLDFSTLERRHYYCLEEARLNRRLAPSIYLDVVPIRRDDSGRVRVGGEGVTVDYAVKMIRLPAERMMDRCLDRGEIDNDSIRDLVALLTDFHSRAATGPEVDVYGSPAAISSVVLENLDELTPFAVEGEMLSVEMLDFLRARAENFLAEQSGRLEDRVTAGRIRDGHGDLHAANICFSDLGILIYDCIEFSPRFRCGDVASDLAFLAMDLDLRCFRGFSRYLVYRYAEVAEDPEMEGLMGFYKSHRALVRAKVAAFGRAGGGSEEEARAALAEARRYVHLAASYALPPAMILMCGLPASGKSWAAREIARPFEAVVVQSDAVRMDPRNSPEDETHSLDAGAYAPDSVERNYRRVRERVEGLLTDGRTVIVDATFGSRARRDSFRDLARSFGVPAVVVHRTCDETLVRERLAQRAGDPRAESHADLQVYELLKERFEPPDEVPVGDRVEAPGNEEGEVLAGRVVEALIRGC